MRIEESIVINRPHEEVFAFFDQRSNDSRWMASVIESEWLDPGESTRLSRKGPDGDGRDGSAGVRGRGHRV